MALPSPFQRFLIGYWWKSDLFATKCVSETIRTARRSFFLNESIDAFQDDLSPLSTKSVIAWDMCFTSAAV